MNSSSALPSPAHAPLHFADRVRRWERRTLIVVAILAGLLLALRLAAPYAVRSAINHRLAKIEGYNGNVRDVDLHLWRGAYELQDVKLTRQVGNEQAPFLAAGDIDFSLAWRELIHGQILSDIAVRDLTLTYVPTPAKEDAASIREVPWQKVIEDIFPIDITRFTVQRGRIEFRDDKANPPVDIALEQLTLEATGLRNRAGGGNEELPAKIHLNGTTIGGGKLVLNIALEPLAARPHFDLDASLEGVSLPALNSYLRAYGKVDVSAGTFKAYSEMAGKDGHFEGYIKPFFNDVSFKDLANEDKSLGQKVWEKVVAGLVTIFKNKSRNQLGTKIPFSGDLDDPKAGLLATFGNLFRHGFIKALTERVEGVPLPDAPGAEASKPDTKYEKK
ncbi:MAG TPA: DUF748 domain-containing protein [Opitutaceae bacterium]|nr:DUF748 domain-containing protein [Opitutaceae bacterium]